MPITISTNTTSVLHSDKTSPAGQMAKYARLYPRQHGPDFELGELFQKAMLWYGNTPPARWASLLDKG